MRCDVDTIQYTLYIKYEVCFLLKEQFLQEQQFFKLFREDSLERISNEFIYSFRNWSTYRTIQENVNDTTLLLILKVQWNEMILLEFEKKNQYSKKKFFLRSKIKSIL